MDDSVMQEWRDFATELEKLAPDYFAVLHDMVRQTVVALRDRAQSHAEYEKLQDPPPVD